MLPVSTADAQQVGVWQKEIFGLISQREPGPERPTASFLLLRVHCLILEMGILERYKKKLGRLLAVKTTKEPCDEFKLCAHRRCPEQADTHFPVKIQRGSICLEHAAALEFVMTRSAKCCLSGLPAS